MTYDNLLIERHEAVALIRLNRPQALNALNDQLIDELNHALEAFGRDDAIRCIVLTGSEKAFAAGADIKAMAGKSFPAVYVENFLNNWDKITACRKPIIAAVAGFAIGGGCELAMMCDLIIAADNAKFGQPEIKLGIIPGAGGTQRLTRLIGRAKAMDLCLTGRLIDALEAERTGLISRIIPAENLIDEALNIARTIAGFSAPAVMMLKESIHRSEETTLSEGLRTERLMFHTLFATDDQKEGMQAFIEKRSAHFNNR
jgi:enoyl-CoA hydratase